MFNFRMAVIAIGIFSNYDIGMLLYCVLFWVTKLPSHTRLHSANVQCTNVFVYSNAVC